MWKAKNEEKSTQRIPMKNKILQKHLEEKLLFFNTILELH